MPDDGRGGFAPQRNRIFVLSFDFLRVSLGLLFIGVVCGLASQAKAYFSEGGSRRLA